MNNWTFEGRRCEEIWGQKDQMYLTAHLLPPSGCNCDVHVVSHRGLRNLLFSLNMGWLDIFLIFFQLFYLSSNRFMSAICRLYIIYITIGIRCFRNSILLSWCYSSPTLFPSSSVFILSIWLYKNLTCPRPTVQQKGIKKTNKWGGSLKRGISYGYVHC